MSYRVTKHFVSGFLKGLTITETTPVEFVVGKTYTPCAGNSAYKILSCEAIQWSTESHTTGEKSS